MRNGEGEFYCEGMGEWVGEWLVHSAGRYQKYTVTIYWHK